MPIDPFPSAVLLSNRLLTWSRRVFCAFVVALLGAGWAEASCGDYVTHGPSPRISLAIRSASVDHLPERLHESPSKGCTGGSCRRAPTRPEGTAPAERFSVRPVEPAVDSLRRAGDSVDSAGLSFQRYGWDSDRRSGCHRERPLTPPPIFVVVPILG